jgi:hypothetical protein
MDEKLRQIFGKIAKFDEAFYFLTGGKGMNDGLRPEEHACMYCAPERIDPNEQMEACTEACHAAGVDGVGFLVYIRGNRKIKDSDENPFSNSGCWTSYNLSVFLAHYLMRE